MKSVQEMSNAFDLYWNNITSNQAPGLNSFEKSSFLTRAQNEYVRNIFDPSSKGNSLGKGFDGSAVRQIDFSNILKSASISSFTLNPSLDSRAIVYELPDDLFIIVNEVMHLADVGKNATRQVIPISYQEYLRLMSKPLGEPFKRQAWRLIVNGGTTNKAEIVLTSADLADYATRSYAIRYVKTPVPIILENLSVYGDITIEGQQEESMCELNEATHEAIVQRAVELAKVAWEGDVNQTQITMTSGQRSE